MKKIIILLICINGSLYFAAQNVAVGTNTPVEKLNINGRIQARGNVIADNNIDTGINIATANFVHTGSAIINAEAAAVGSIKTFSDLNLDNSNATVQPQSFSEKKVFF